MANPATQVSTFVFDSSPGLVETQIDDQDLLTGHIHRNNRFECFPTDKWSTKEPADMISFAVIEVDDGFTIVEVMEGQSVEDAALNAGGELVDPGPYTSYEEACDALDQLEEDEDDDV